MSTVFVQAPNGSLKYTFEWEDVLPAEVTLQAVSYDVGNLTITSEALNSQDATSSIQLEGIEHAGLYVVRAIATLSNGELVPDHELVIRGFNG